MALQGAAMCNFDTLTDAARRHDLCIMECTERETGRTVALVCAVHMEDGQFCFTPLARMLEGNPYVDYVPPMEEEFSNGYEAYRVLREGER